jgi:D-glycero-alpha-D-manno-heptose-7-phosphate kinase
MIISRTPFRVSFLGGGTDLEEFYKEEEGAVLSTTISKYMYVTINDRFDESYRLSYSRTEIANHVDQIEHPILRAVLKKYARPKEGLEVISMADIPAGTGLGSSSSFTVGLLHALKAHHGLFQSAEELAAEASTIEIEDLKEPIGKQDQYAAAYGGLQVIRFLPDGKVRTDPVICSTHVQQALENSMLLLYTGQTRAASDVLTVQKATTSLNRSVLRQMRDMAYELQKILQRNVEVSAALDIVKTAGELMHEGWNLKKSLVKGISTQRIDTQYEVARQHGAWGGKILGAGGGGFLLLLAPPDQHLQILNALPEMRQVPIKLEPWGSRIIFVG